MLKYILTFLISIVPIVELREIEACLPAAVDRNRLVFEVDRTGSGLMNATDIHGKLAVDEHPQVIVAREFEGDRIPARILYGLRILRQAEIDAHRHAEMVV